MDSHTHCGRRWPRPAAASFAALGVIAGSVVTATPVYAAPSSMANTGLSSVYFASVAAPERPVPLTLELPKPSFFPPMPLRYTVATLTSTSSTIASGQSVTLTGRVTTGKGRPVANGPAVLEIDSGSGWRTVATAKLAQGTASFTIKPSKSSTYRLSFSGTADSRASVSAALKISVRIPTSTATATYSDAAGSWSTSPATGLRAEIVAYARAQIGKPYVYATAGPDTFDCSGLTQYVFKKFGITLPRTANSQKSYGRAVSISEALPGDLVIFVSGGYGYHAAIYVGNGYIIDAPEPGRTVTQRKIWTTSVVVRRVI